MTANVKSDTAESAVGHVVATARLCRLGLHTHSADIFWRHSANGFIYVGCCATFEQRACSFLRGTSGRKLSIWRHYVRLLNKQRHGKLPLATSTFRTW